MTLALQIIVYVAAIDGFRTSRRFKTLAAAQRFAQERVGATPELGSGYAVAADGVVKVSVRGCALVDLFPALAADRANDEEVEFERVMREEAAAERALALRDAEEAAAAYRAAYEPKRIPGCRCSDQQLNLVGCECEISREAKVVRVTVTDIANPGYGPIFACEVRADDGFDYVFTDARVLTNDERAARRFAAKVAKAGVIRPTLWDRTTMTPAEREAYYGPGGDLWQWEEGEKAGGRW